MYKFNCFRFFQRAITAQETTPLSPSDHQTLSVTEIQEEEDNIIGEIYETIPMMNLGDDENALKKSKDLYETINDRYDNHPDYEVLLNNIGLAIQRVGGDSKDALFWFEKSLNQRYLLAKINPLNLVVTLNNVAMLKFSAGKFAEAEKELLRGLDILREGYWYHHNCAILLNSLADVSVKLKKIHDVCLYLTQAEEILEKVNKDHQLRLQVNMKLIHFQLLLDSQGDTVRQSKESRQQLESQLEVVMDLGSRLRRRMGEDGHHNLISAYEHGLVFNWRGSRSNSYREMLLTYVEENRAIREAIDKRVSSLLGNHRHFVEYVKNTREENWKFEEMLKNLNKSCSVCRNINRMLDIEMWLIERLAPLQPDVTISSLEMCDTDQHRTYRLLIHPHYLLRKTNSSYVLLYYKNVNKQKFNLSSSDAIAFLQSCTSKAQNNFWSCRELVIRPLIFTCIPLNPSTLDVNISLSNQVINRSIESYSVCPELFSLSYSIINSSLSAERLNSMGLSLLNPSGSVENTYSITSTGKQFMAQKEDGIISLTCINVSSPFPPGLADHTSYISTSYDPRHLIKEGIMVSMNCMNVSSSFISGFAEDTSLNQAIFGPFMTVGSVMGIGTTRIDLSKAVLSELGDRYSLTTSILNPSLTATEDLIMIPYCINVSRCVSMCAMESNTFPLSPDKSNVNNTDNSESSSFVVLDEVPRINEANQANRHLHEFSSSSSSFSVIDSPISEMDSSISVINSSISSSSSSINDVTGSGNSTEVQNSNVSCLTELNYSTTFSVINSSISSISTSIDSIPGSVNSSVAPITYISDLTYEPFHELNSSTSSSFSLQDSHSISFPSSIEDDQVGHESSNVTEK